MKTYTNNERDRSGWPSGPWDGEPDKVSWTDEATGLPCLIVRGPTGALCGYVGVSEDHPWHGLDWGEHLPIECDSPDEWCWDHSPANQIDIHGGMNYSAACQEGRSEEAGICHIPEPGQSDNVWWFGFDCAHAYDTAPAHVDPYNGTMPGEIYRNIAYVRSEVESLACQLKERA